MENVTNEENQWEHEVSSSVKDKSTDCITMPNVTSRLKNNA